ncbi:hypothetical protein Scep_005913 [Stephania cephalantha]|uniref:Transcription elongation factor n=1 Tax=Stephania cephalantha TaxID=152367 RepID=A0AAP0PYM4_9MAGN
MEKELLELFDSAKRAADAATKEGSSSSSEEGRCIDALKQLKNFPVTTKILVETQVGKRLRHLTKHPRERIQALAADLLDIWKNTVLEESSKNKHNGSSELKNSGASKAETVKVEKVQKVNAVKVEKVSHSETIKVEKTERHSQTVKVEKAESIKVEKNGRSETVKVEKISKEESRASGMKRPLTEASNGAPKLTSMIKCNDALRDKVRELLAEALSKVPGEADEDVFDEVNACDPIRIAVSVESALFEKMGRSNGPQKFKYRSIMFNIKDPNNPDLRRKVLLGVVKPERLINMTPEEMASEQRKRENSQIKEKALFDCERGGPPKATTDQFKCGRCGQRKTTYYQLQTRSADEPMTTFVTCVNCNNHWKFC